jgi:aminoglycoside phosphotransferase (APT) family kinase protein
MTGFIKQHSPEWIDFFVQRGHPDVSPLAAGTEGAVYRLGDGMIAKVWAARPASELARMRELYADVRRAGLPFLTPVIDDVHEVDGVCVTFERELPGRPLREVMVHGAGRPAEEEARCVVDVLRGLATVPASRSMRSLAVLDEDHAFWDGRSGFGDALIALLNRRAGLFGDVLRRRVTGFDRLLDAVVTRLGAIGEMPLSVVHGDLFPGNLLVDESSRPLALIDFGFLTTAGDPRFDAAISAAIFDMYGTHARDVRLALTASFARELGHDAGELILFQAAYALATSNAFAPDGSDGHFAWCAALLNDPVTTGALGL